MLRSANFDLKRNSVLFRSQRNSRHSKKRDRAAYELSTIRTE